MHQARQKRELVVRHAGMNVVVHLLQRSGPVRGRILFVNGAFATQTALRWAEHGLGDFDLVTFDFPMVGLSQAANPGLAGLSRADEVGIVATLVERFAPDYLISLSWGGAAALTAVAKAPGSVRRAIVSSFSFGLTDSLRRLCVDISALVEADRLAPAARAVVSELGERLPARMRQACEDYFVSLDRRQLAYVVRHMREAAALGAEDHVDLLRAIQIPVLFGNGAADRFTPPEAARPFAAHIARASFQTFPDAGHFLALESAATRARVCEGINAFLTEPAPALSRVG